MNITRRFKALTALLTGTLVASLLFAALALADSRKVVTLGADLTPEQQQSIIRFFGVKEGEAEFIYITNADEHAHLDGLMPLEQIGNKTYSCALVSPKTSGGIHVKTANLNYVTSNIIASTLATSGVVNCDVVAACPFEVSGTGALTGVMMAYETASGEALDTAKKELANEELVTTGQLAQTVGQNEATLIVNDIKINIIREDISVQQDVDYVVNTVVQNTVNAMEQRAAETGAPAPAPLSDADYQMLYDYGYKVAQMDYDYADVQPTLEMVTTNVVEAAALADPIVETFDSAVVPEEIADDSILVTTDITALGEDIIIDSTDQDALTADDIFASRPVEELTPVEEVVPEDDPFATLQWDEAVIDEGQEGAAEPAEPVAEPVEEPAAEPAEPVTEPVAEPVEEPAVEAPIESLDEIVVEPIVSGPAQPLPGDGVSLSVVGPFEQTRFVDGTNLLIHEQEDGTCSLVDVNGNVVTTAAYARDFSYNRGYIETTVDAGNANARGLLRPDGTPATAFEYAKISFYGQQWAAGLVAAAGDESNYDFQLVYDGDYYLIDRVDLYYLPSGTVQPVASLTRDQFEDAYSDGSYINVLDRSTQVVSAYDPTFTQVATDLSNLYSYNDEPAGYTAFRGDDGQGVMDASGYVVVPAVYQYVDEIRGDLVEVSKDDMYGLVDLAGNVVVPAEYDRILTNYDAPTDRYVDGQPPYDANNYFCVVKDGLVGYVYWGEGESVAPAHSYENAYLHGAALSIVDDQGVQHLVAADGVDTSMPSECIGLYGIDYTSGMLWEYADSSSYYLIDWHGNHLLDRGFDNYYVSGDGRYVLAIDYNNGSYLYEVAYDVPARPVVQPSPVAEPAEGQAEPAAEAAQSEVAAAEPASEPAADATAEPTEPAAEPVEPAAEPAAEPVEPAAEPATEAAAEPAPAAADGVFVSDETQGEQASGAADLTDLSGLFEILTGDEYQSGE